jgi:hypothetical protein
MGEKVSPSFSCLDTHEPLVLEPWLKNFKDLGAACQLKEQFYDIRESRDREEALERYQKWRSQIPEQLETAFKPLTTAVPSLFFVLMVLLSKSLQCECISFPNCR